MILLKPAVIFSNEPFFVLLFFWSRVIQQFCRKEEKAYPKSTGSFFHPLTILPSDAQSPKFRGHWGLCTGFHGCYKQTSVPIPSVK